MEHNFDTFIGWVFLMVIVGLGIWFGPHVFRTFKESSEEAEEASTHAWIADEESPLQPEREEEPLTWEDNVKILWTIYGVVMGLGSLFWTVVWLIALVSNLLEPPPD